MRHDSIGHCVMIGTVMTIVSRLSPGDIHMVSVMRAGVSPTIASILIHPCDVNFFGIESGQYKRFSRHYVYYRTERRA